jgi:hypothetical protein
MITLKIKKPGYTVDIPGLPTCRSPVEFDISKLDIRVVAMSLKTAGITEYEIVAELGKDIKEVYTKKDFEAIERINTKPSKEIVDLNKRFNKLEKMLSSLLTEKKRSSNKEKEQITNKLDTLERLIKSRSIHSGEVIDNEPEIEEFESFIPDIDTSKMKIESKTLKTIKKESDDLDDTVDALSSLIKKK